MNVMPNTASENKDSSGKKEDKPLSISTSFLPLSWDLETSLMLREDECSRPASTEIGSMQSPAQADRLRSKLS
jgi:hypothetical protein